MKLNVPEPVAGYLAAEEAKDAEKLALCFTNDATVRDEGEDHYGRVAPHASGGASAWPIIAVLRREIALDKFH